MIEKRARKLTTTKSYSTDTLMKKVWVSLLRDFRTNLNSPQLFERQKSSLSCTKAFRTNSWPSKSTASISIFKAQYQLENLFKRYTFIDDVFSSEERKCSALKNFADYQTTLAVPICTSEISFRVLQRARIIVKGILGDFSQQELLEEISFGKRANYGVPYADSYLDVKMENLSGSFEHRTWFKNHVVQHDVHLRLWLEERINLVLATRDGHKHLPFSDVATHLNVVSVPKTFKTDRTITPNSVLGALHSGALGNMIRYRLKRNGLDIAKLQEQQKALAKSASRTRHLVTADLSKASDSFTWELMNKVVPRPWLRALNFGRLRQCKVSGSLMYLTSFMAMGIGFTFPLETLMFYGILVAIQQLTDVKGRISVYGDDLIYPRALHKYVVDLFPKLGLQLNVDKTFCEDYFRESCGGDYYHGVDVRPFQPEQIGGKMGRMQYLQFLYKILNGLMRRWDKVEIPQAVHLLLREIVGVQGTVYLVPPSFPDGSGLKVEVPKLEWYIPFTGPMYNKVSQQLNFPYLRQVAEDRLVPHVFPYYWEALRKLGKAIEPKLPWEDASDAQTLEWVTLQSPKKTKRGIAKSPMGTRFSHIRTSLSAYTRMGLSRVRCLQMFPVVLRKGTGCISVSSASTWSWSLPDECVARDINEMISHKCYTGYRTIASTSETIK